MILSQSYYQKEQILLPSEIYHLHGFGDDGLQGYSVVSLASQAIGLGLAAESFGSSLFGNGAQLGGAFEHPKRLSKDAPSHSIAAPSVLKAMIVLCSSVPGRSRSTTRGE